MLQHLLRRLVFDVPILNEYAKMPLKVGGSKCFTAEKNPHYSVSKFLFTSTSF